MTAAAGGALVEIGTTEVADDWGERWRQFHQPLVLDSRLTVRPPWAPPAPTPIDLVIDPGQAFGTGAHATTRLCLEAMLELVDAGPSEGAFVDLGCGSGVLAIAAARLGWAPVLALDNDPAAVEAAGKNARVNGVALEVGRYDLRADPVELAVAPTVAANLLAPLLLAWARRLHSASALPGTIIASGLLPEEGDAVAAAFAALGFQEAERRPAGGWLALRLDRRGA